MNFFEIIINSIKLILSLDAKLYEIIILSLSVSLIALAFASLLGIITGFLLTIKNFYLKSFTTIILNALMGIPPVVVGLIVYFLFARSGPLGIFELLYTPYAMIVAQSIIIFPIVSSLSHELFEHNWKQFKDHFRAFNVPLIGIVFIIIRNNYYIIITIILSGFGRAISEVGAVMIVGGNIEHYTRVMTTAITLQTRMGNLDYAMALGIVLILITVVVNSLVYILKK
jgi:tungstate transport system permease protein